MSSIQIWHVIHGNTPILPSVEDSPLATRRHALFMTEQRVRRNPRISVIKLAEYMVATPARRRGIIRDQKTRREFIVTRYQSVYGGIAEALATGDVGPIYNRLERLYTAVPTSTWELQDNQLSVEVLELFLPVFDELDLSRYQVGPLRTCPR